MSVPVGRIYESRGDLAIREGAKVGCASIFPALGGAGTGGVSRSLASKFYPRSMLVREARRSESVLVNPSRPAFIRPPIISLRFDRGGSLCRPSSYSLQARPERAMGDRHQDREQESERAPSAFDDISALQRALEIARSTDQADLDPVLRDLLERAFAEVWDRIRANPTTYILTKDEFAVFNFYQNRWPSHELGESATARFWNAYRNQPGDSV